MTERYHATRCVCHECPFGKRDAEIRRRAYTILEIVKPDFIRSGDPGHPLPGLRFLGLQNIVRVLQHKQTLHERDDITSAGKVKANAC